MVDFRRLLKPVDPNLISPHIRKRAADPNPVSLTEWQEIRCNTYERELLMPLLTDEALLHVVEDYSANVQSLRTKAAGSYEAALIHLVLPILVERLKKCKGMPPEDKNEYDQF